MRAAALDEAALAKTLASGQTDRLGQVATETLPPGKYYVMDFRSGLGLSAFGVNKLWAERLSLGTEVELGRGGFRQVRLTLVEFR